MKTFLLACCFLFSKRLIAQSPNEATLLLRFQHKVGSSPLQLHQQVYQNPWNENYIVEKLKYYLGHIQLINTKQESISLSPDYFLLDANDSNSLTLGLLVPAQVYRGLSFQLGVDSALQTEGVQLGSLDPIHGMYWTWNSGYVAFKVEGHSPQSTAPMNRYEYHLGGYAGKNKIIKQINLPFSSPAAFPFQPGNRIVIEINVDMDQLWQGPMQLKLSETNLCNQPGETAAQIANNVCRLFVIHSISIAP